MFGAVVAFFFSVTQREREKYAQALLEERKIRHFYLFSPAMSTICMLIFLCGLFLLALLSFFPAFTISGPARSPSYFFLSLSLSRSYFFSRALSLVSPHNHESSIILSRKRASDWEEEEKKRGNSNERKAVPIIVIDIKQIVPLAFLCSLMQ